MGLLWSPLAVRRLDRSDPLPSRLAVQDRDGIPIVLQGVLVAIADADGTDLAVLGERPDEMENHPLLGGAVEVEAVVDSYIHQIVRGQALVCGALEVIRSVVIAGLRRRRAVQSVIGVVGTVRQETQDQVRMRVAALAKVDLDSRVLPALAAPDGDKIDGEPSQGAAFPEHLTYSVSGLLDVAAVLGVSGERAAEEDLARRPSQNLVVRGDYIRLPKGIDPTLHRRRAYLLTLQPALHDAAHLLELPPVTLPGLSRCLELDAPRQLVPNPGHEVSPLRRAVVGEDGVPLTRETLIQLYGRPSQPWLAALELDDGLDHVVLISQVLEAVWERDPGLPERLAAAALGPEVIELRIVAVERDAKPDGEAPFQGRTVEAGHVRRLRVCYRRAYPLHQTRTVGDLLRQRHVGGVVAREERQPAAGVTQRDARQEMQVIVHYGRRDVLARDVDDVGAGQPQEHQHAQQPFLVVVRAGDLRHLLDVEREAGHHHDRLRGARVGDHAPRQRSELRLQCREALELLRGARFRHINRRRWCGDHTRHSCSLREDYTRGSHVPQKLPAVATLLPDRVASILLYRPQASAILRMSRSLARLLRHSSGTRRYPL